MDDYLDMTGISPYSIQLKLLHASVCDDILLAERCLKDRADPCYIFRSPAVLKSNWFNDYAHFSGTYYVTAFQEACGRLNIEMVKLMLKYGANPNIECFIEIEDGIDGHFDVGYGFNVGSSPLHAAVIPLQPHTRSDKTDLQKCKIVKLLIEAGADPYKHIENDGRSLYDLVKVCNPPVARIFKKRCLETPLSAKEVIYENVLKRNIPILCNEIKFKPGNMGSKIVALHHKLVQSSLLMDDVDADIKEYLGIYNEDQLYKIAEYLS